MKKRNKELIKCKMCGEWKEPYLCNFKQIGVIFPTEICKKCEKKLEKDKVKK